MRPTSHAFPARCSLHVGDHVLPALPVHLDGQGASVVVEHPPRQARPVRLFVDWDTGGCTELAGRVRGESSDGQITHLDLFAVGGDWQPFLAWLGSRASA